MMNCPMVSFWAMCPFPLQKTSERISIRIPYFVLFHIVSWAPLPLDNAAHQACVTIVHKNIWKHRNIFPPNWNLDSSKFFPQDDTPNYHSLSFSTKTLMFEQTLDNPPHVEIFLPRKHIPKKSHTALPPCLFMWLRCKYGNIRHPLGNLSTLDHNRHHHNHNPAGKEYNATLLEKTAQAFVQPCQRTFCLCKIIPKALFCSKLPGDVKPLYFLSNKLQTIFETLFIIFYSENSSSTTLKT